MFKTIDITGCEASYHLFAIRTIVLYPILLLSDFSDKFTALDLKSTDPAVIIFTAGLLGKAYGATLSHGNLDSNSIMLQETCNGDEKDHGLALIPLFHAFGAAVAGVAVLVALVLGVGEAAGPLGGDAGGEPAVEEALEAVLADGEELGAVVEGGAVQAARRHPAADAAAFIEDGHAPSGVLELVRGEEA